MKIKPREKIMRYPEVKIRHVVRAFWRGVRPYKVWLFLLFTGIVLSNIIGMIVPLFYKHFFDLLVSGGNPNTLGAMLIGTIIKIALLNGIIWFSYRFSAFIDHILVTGVIAKLKQQAFEYLLDHSYGFYSNHFTGSLVQRVNRFARAFERISDRLFWNVLPLVVRIISVVVVVSFIRPFIAEVIVAWVCLFLGFNIFYSRWKFKYDVQVAEMDSRTTGFLADTITNHNAIQLFTGGTFEAGEFRAITGEQARMTKRLWNLDSVIDAVQGFLVFLAEFALFYFTIRYWQDGLVTVGVFVLFQSYLIGLGGQLWDFARVVRDAYQAYADAKEMVELMLLPHEIKDLPGAKKLSVGKGLVEFRNVTFSFNQKRDVLKNIDLKIMPGEKVALIGPSGAGKTTFVRLLLRLYAPTNGQIVIDEVDIAKATQESLRRNISMVPQDPVLFHRTLLENIGYGKREARPGEIMKAGKLAHCDEFVKDLPMGYDTYVGERGIKLSGGERQRVAIARAILKNAPILILDEATSSLDSHSETLIQDALDTLMKGKTVLVIAHRLSTIRKMDRIIVIDNGKIIEEGKHDALIEKEGSLYKKLWTLQAGGFIKMKHN